MDERRAVVFDLDGVVRHRCEQALADMAAASQLSTAELSELASGSAVIADALVGRACAETWLAAVTAQVELRSGVPGLAPAVRTWLEDPGRIDPAVMTLARDLRTPGTLVVLASNATHAVRRQLCYLAIQASWDQIFVSAELGVAKPDPAFFALVCDRLELSPDRLFLIDDRATNIAVARGLGLETYRFGDVAEARSRCGQWLGGNQRDPATAP